MNKVKLGDLVSIKTGRLNANAAEEDGKYPFFTTAEKVSRINSYSYEGEVVLVAGNGDLNVKYYNGKFDAYQRTYILSNKNEEKLDMKYLYYFMSLYVERLRNEAIGGVIKYIKKSNLTEAKVPLPDLNTQQEIIKILEQTESIINKRINQLQDLDKLVLSIFQKTFRKNVWKKEKLKNVVKIDIKSTKEFSNYANYYYLGVEDIERDTGKVLNKIRVSETEIKSTKNLFTSSHILYSKIRPNLNKVAIPNFDGVVSTDVFPLLPKENINKYYLTYVLRGPKFLKYAETNATGANIPRLNKSTLNDYDIDVPPIELQNEFSEKVKEVEAVKEKMQASLDEMNTLFEALMQKAFTGELV